MRLSVCLTSFFLLLAGVAPLQGQREHTLTSERKAEILAAVFAVRSAAVPDSSRIDACGIHLAFDGEAGFAERFLPWVRARLVGEVGPDCRESPPRLDLPGRLWVLRRIDVEHGYKVIVRGEVISRTYSQREAYGLRRDHAPGARWRVDDIQISDFLHSDPPPPPPSS